VAEALAPVAGVERVSLDFDVMSPEEKAALTTKLHGGVTERAKGISLDRATRVINRRSFPLRHLPTRTPVTTAMS
jgi:hypothetical protein